MPNWAEQVTAIATVVLAIGAVGAIGAAIFAGQQVRETRRLVASYASPDALRDALLRHVAANDTEAYVLFRELDYFEQLGAMEQHGGFDFELVRLLLGHRLVDRWELWRPSIDALGGPQVYPLFDHLARKMERAIAAG
jgi:hypothetical protein